MDDEATPILDLLEQMTTASLEASGLDEQTLMLVRIAALIALASVAAAARMVAVSARSISVVSTLPSAARSIVIAATAPSRVLRIVSVMVGPQLRPTP